MTDPERTRGRFEGMLVTLTAVGCVGVVTLSGLAFFMFYSCSNMTM